jgi:hypothetical protein
MAINEYHEPNKITLARWVDKTRDQLLTEDNIRLGFKFISIWPLNPRVMDEKT